MKFMILLKADKNTEAGVLPDEKLLTDMMVIAFQSSPILSLPRAWRDFSSVLLRFTAPPATTADTAGFLPTAGVG